ncbi:dihydrofolate reductase-like isoform X2 [Labeo rohita]|uniref:dihydrofolate reductase n=1 Tax=Labeo rohita TaxID=84645 RepID=A0A498NK61_LABRO|nr:dihydrofolate reductase-like isoform X2 [Labeo rohita]
MWVKDYAQKYMDQYFFRYVMGPFSSLPGDLLDELLCILSSRNLLTRAALHLLLLPQLSCLSLTSACNLVNANLCSLIQIRCQNLQSLDLSGSQNISVSVLCELLGCQTRLRSLSLAGTQCDQKVVSVVSRQCPKLKHLDVSRCLHLTPAGLLPLVYQVPLVKNANILSSLLALDIGLAENDSDAVAAVAFLLLSLPSLQRLAIEGLGQACVLIQNKQFEVTEEFSSREGVPLLKDMWAKHTQEDHLKDSSLLSADGEESFTLEGKIDDCLSLEECQMEASNSTDINERTSGEGCEKDGGRSKDSVTTSLRDVQGLSLDTLEAVGSVCPELRVLSLDCLQSSADDNVDSFEQATVLARGLGRFSGQLRCLSLQFAGLLSELVPALQAAGSHLLSLTLEGIKADGHTPLLELIRACPRLTSLSVHLDPPRNNLDGNDDEEDDEDEGLLANLPCIPHLRSLTLNNEFKHFQKMTMTPSVEGKKNVVLMGRKTWFSIPVANRPLKNRINIVLSRELKTAPEGAHYLASDFSSALHLLDSSELEKQVDQVWIIGGSALYKEVMESSGPRRLFVTRVLKQFDCDTFIPDINTDKYKLLPEFPGVPTDLQEENGVQYVFEVYESTNH